MSKRGRNLTKTKIEIKQKSKILNYEKKGEKLNKSNDWKIKQNFEKFGIEIWYQTELKQKAIHQKQNHKYNANK